MRITTRRETRQSLLVREGDLKSLYDFIASKYKGISLVAVCRDGSRLEAKAADELLAYENPSFARIVSLDIEGRDGFGESVSLEIGTRPSGSPLGDNSAEIRTNSEDPERSRHIADELFRRLKSMKPWYDVIARVSLFFVLFGVFVVAALIYNAGRLFGFVRSPAMPSAPSAGDSLVLVFLIFLYAVTYPLDSFRRWLFPHIFFAIRRQKEVTETVERTRRNLFWVLVSAVASLLVAGLYARFSR